MGTAKPTRLTTGTEWPTPLDWLEMLSDDGIPEPDYLVRPHVPRGVRIWAIGPTDVGKSLWALWVAAHVSNAGHAVAFFSQENTRDEDVRRLALLGPNPDLMRVYSRQGVDLAQRDHAAIVLRIAEEMSAALVVFDTLSACWSESEDDNTAVAALDREVLLPITQAGGTCLVLDHTGHAKRRGTDAARGASSKGQKADVTLSFRRGRTDREFIITTPKFRVGGGWVPDPVTYRVVDRNGGIDFDVVGRSNPDLMGRVAEFLADVDGDFPNQRAIRDGVTGKTADIVAALGALVAEGRVQELHDVSGNHYRLTEEEPPQ